MSRSFAASARRMREGKKEAPAVKPGLRMAGIFRQGLRQGRQFV
jgi:hypothetical protein